MKSPRCSSELTSHVKAKPLPVRVVASAERHDDGLAFEFVVTGALDALAWPKPGDVPRGRLWTSTCFEFFARVPGSSLYIEGNVSPSGESDLFLFGAERQRTSQPPVATTLEAIHTERTGDRATIRFRWRACGSPLFDWALASGASLELSLTAVLKGTDGSTDYRAAAHKRAEPDFHAPDSFVLKI